MYKHNYEFSNSPNQFNITRNEFQRWLTFVLFAISTFKLFPKLNFLFNSNHYIRTRQTQASIRLELMHTTHLLNCKTQLH